MSRDSSNEEEQAQYFGVAQQATSCPTVANLNANASVIAYE